jgi:hypothetical protein
VTYQDGDEEELSQKELRDCYILALAPEIEAQWALFNKTKTQKSSGDKSESSVQADSDDQAVSDGEGSLYDKCSDEEELEKKKIKDAKRRPHVLRRRVNNLIMSGLVLPVAGDKTVATEAFGKLNPKQKELVANNIN